MHGRLPALVGVLTLPHRHTAMRDPVSNFSEGWLEMMISLRSVKLGGYGVAILFGVGIGVTLAGGANPVELVAQGMVAIMVTAIALMLIEFMIGIVGAALDSLLRVIGDGIIAMLNEHFPLNIPKDARKEYWKKKLERQQAREEREGDPA